MGYLAAAAIYLVQALFGLYILAVLLRLLLQLVRADFYNPIAQVLVTITRPALRPLRRVIPGLWGVDLASVALLLALQCAEIYLVALLEGAGVSAAGLIIVAVASLLQLTFYVLLFTLIVRVIASWISPFGRYNPTMDLLVSLTEPVMRPARRLIPPLSGLDLSPIVVFLALGLIQILVIEPLAAFGWGLMH